MSQGNHMLPAAGPGPKPGPREAGPDWFQQSGPTEI